MESTKENNLSLERESQRHPQATKLRDGRQSRRFFSRSSTIGIALSRVLPRRQYKSHDQDPSYKGRNLLKVAGRLVDGGSSNIDNDSVKAFSDTQKQRQRHLWRKSVALSLSQRPGPSHPSEPSNNTSSFQSLSRVRNSIGYQFATLWRPEKEFEYAEETPEGPREKHKTRLRQYDSHSSMNSSTGSSNLETRLRTRASESTHHTREEEELQKANLQSPSTAVNVGQEGTVDFANFSSPVSVYIPEKLTQEPGIEAGEGAKLLSGQKQQCRGSFRYRIDIKRLRKWREKKRSEKIMSRELETRSELQGPESSNSDQFDTSFSFQPELPPHVPSISNSPADENSFIDYPFPYPPANISSPLARKVGAVSQEHFITPRSSSLNTPIISQIQAYSRSASRSDRYTRRKYVDPPPERLRISSSESDHNGTELLHSLPDIDLQAAPSLRRSELTTLNQNNLDRHSWRAATDTHSSSNYCTMEHSPAFSDPGIRCILSINNQSTTRNLEPIRPRPKAPQPLPITRLPKIANPVKPALSNLRLELNTGASMSPEFITDQFLATPDESHQDITAHNDCESLDQPLDSHLVSRYPSFKNDLTPVELSEAKPFRRRSRGKGKAVRYLTRFSTNRISRPDTPIFLGQESPTSDHWAATQRTSKGHMSEPKGVKIHDPKSSVFVGRVINSTSGAPRYGSSLITGNIAILDPEEHVEGAAIDENDIGGPLPSPPSSALVAEASIQETATATLGWPNPIPLLLKLALDPTSGLRRGWAQYHIDPKIIVMVIIIAPVLGTYVLMQLMVILKIMLAFLLEVFLEYLGVYIYTIDA